MAAGRPPPAEPQPSGSAAAAEAAAGRRARGGQARSQGMGVVIGMSAGCLLLLASGAHPHLHRHHVHASRPSGSFSPAAAAAPGPVPAAREPAAAAATASRPAEVTAVRNEAVLRGRERGGKKKPKPGGTGAPLADAEARAGAAPSASPSAVAPSSLEERLAAAREEALGAADGARPLAQADWEAELERQRRERERRERERAERGADEEPEAGEGAGANVYRQVRPYYQMYRGKGFTGAFIMHRGKYAAVGGAKVKIAKYKSQCLTLSAPRDLRRNECDTVAMRANPPRGRGYTTIGEVGKRFLKVRRRGAPRRRRGRPRRTTPVLTAGRPCSTSRQRTCSGACRGGSRVPSWGTEAACFGTGWGRSSTSTRR